ncbi:beta strand repeat-containing protein [Candidatus Spongiihabitans sp.]|uniref:beta strand repeat-containing protein n=1 Tax=Candidatus Spongiihabitans sp. TaxID=3101308 RepID=UPI003C7D1134
MPAAPRLAALLLGPLMVIGLLLGLASPAAAQTFPQPVGIGATPNEIRTINLYFQFGVATDNLVFPAATGGLAVTYSVTGNPGLKSLGFSFNPANRTFSGTPTLAGAGEAGDGFAFNYRANSSGGGFALIFVKVTVCEGSGNPDGATACTPPAFAALGFAERPASQRYTVGTAVDLTLPEATGGTGSSPRYIYGLTSFGGLPDGLSFDAATRRLTGTPTTAKQSTPTYRVQDAASLKRFNRQFALSVAADITPPTVTLDPIAEGVIGMAQDYDITFSEAVTGLAVGDFSVSKDIEASGDLVVNSVTPASGPSTTYTISITPRATAFTLTLAADSVTDTATTPNMGPATEASATGTATEPMPTKPVVVAPAPPVEFAENATGIVVTFIATATGDRTIAGFTLGGTDAGDFTLDNSGALTFAVLPNFEAPADANFDNRYEITVTAIVSASETSDALAVTITVTNVDEPGAISAITGDAQVGATLTAGTVTDEDSPSDGTPVSGITHQWQSAVDGTDAAAAVDDAAWPPISGATDATYEPDADDVGKIIRVVATYTDGEGSGKKVASAAIGAVAAAALSADSTLSALDVSAGTLNPTFASGTNAYAVSVGTDVASVTVTPTTTDDGATVAVNGVAVASGQPSEAIDLNVGNNTIPILVVAEDGVEEQTYTVTVARAVPPPGIALASDTARDGGTNTDRLTRNRSIVVTLHADFQNDRDTWEWSSNSGNSHTTGSNTDRSFDLDVAQATYNDNVVRARQTVNGVVSEFAGLAMFQHDTVKPTISLNGGGASVTITKGDAYNDPVTADDALDGPIDPSNIVITGGPVDVDTAGEYTLTYNVMDRAGNAADPLTRTVTVSEPTATTPEPPVLSAGTITNTSVVLEWTAVDNAASYTLTRVVAGGANVVVFSGNALTATDTGLTAETPYKYVVTVTVGGRTSADSNEVDATTLVAPVTTPAPTVTVERLSDNSIEVSWDNIDGVDFTIYAIKTGEADAVIIALVTSPHTIATTDPLFDTVNNADAIGVRGFAEGNPVGDHSAQITSDEVPPVDITAPPVPVITTSPATVGSTPITIDGTAEAGTTVELFNGVTSAGTVTAADGTGAFSFAVTLTEGTNTFTATASDGPNTSDASSPVVITLDTETPEAPIITTSPATVNSPSIMIVGTAEAGTTVELLNGVTSAGTVTAADGTGAFSFTVTLTEGTNTFTATASDGPNTSAASPAVVITLDTETPEAPIITTSPATVNSPSIMIVGTAEAGTTVELFNGVTSAGTVTADSGSFSFTGVALNPGANSFTATASDGPNKSAESSAVTITLDTETPEAPEITTPSETVNSPSITIAGTAEAGTTVELFNGVTSAGTVTAADGTGAFSFTVTLTEGANTFTATASDGVNTSAASPPVLITLDTETPEAPIITTQTATVNSPSITITGTAEAGTTVELLKGGTSTGDTVTAAAGTGTFSFTVTLTEGTNTFTATASDGPNTSASSSPVLITLDTETPEVPAITTSPATVNSPSITITGTAEAGTTVDLLKEGTSSVGTTTADGTGNFSFAVTLTEGTNTFTATASDGTNKSAASPAVVITLDTIAPAVPAITTSPATVGSTPITIVGTAEAGTTVELFNGVTSAGTVTADSGSFSFTGVALNPGANSFTATASDGVNTSASSPAVVITLDTETPEVPAITTSPATVGSTPITIDGTAEAGATVELFNGVTSAGTVTADSGSFSFTGVALNPGANSFTATASDGVNTSAASSPVVITLDTETPAPPAITTSPATVNTPSITIVGTAEAGTTVELFNGVTSAGTVTADSGSFSFTVTLTEGTNTFTATASDGVNKSAASPAVVITLDTVAPAPPTITTSPATVDTASFTIEGIAEAGTTVNLLKGGASVDTTTADSGNFSFAVTLTEGTNTFTATASDGTNKSAASPTVVITLDTIAPAVPAITTSPATVGSTPITIVGTAEAGTTVDLLKEGTSSVGTTTADGDGNFSFAGVALTEGANSFTATASDGPNTSAASSPVVITLDTETPPVPAITTSPATVGSTPITIDGTAEAGTTVELFNGVTSAGTVTADSGSFSFTGVALNPGANSFTATASDGPNTSAASPPVVITLDTTAPAIEVILSEVARVIADQNISAIAGRVERARTQQNGASSFNFAGQQMSFNGNGGRNDNGDQAMSSTVANLMNTHASSMEDGTLDMKTLLGNSEFTMPLNFVGGEDSSGITFWGSGDYRNFGGEDDDQELDWDGDMFSVHFGLDGRTAEAIGGVALSWNEGELETDDKTTYDISLTSINPYFGWGGARGEVWMTAGYGSGELKRDNGASNDLSMSTFAIGGNGIVRQRGASTLRLKGEVSQSTLEVDANKDNSGLEASEVDTNRVRVSLESTNTIALDNGARTERSAEAGIRHDGGDGATGSGAELGFGISHVNANGFSVEGKARVLLGHDGDANEWGVSGAIKKTAGADGQGWSFALSPGYGDDAGDIQRLWDEGLRDADGNATATDTDTAADATRDYAARLDLRVGYGMNGFTGPSWLGSGRGLLTPYTAMTLSDDSNRYRLGIQWKLGNRLDLDLVGEHRDTDDDDTILLKGELRF